MHKLEAKNIAKIIKKTQILYDISLEVNSGETVGLLGPNGAGKTTAFNIITGNYKPTSGEVTFKNENITDKKPSQIVRLGIARTFQNIRLFKSMSVLENVLIGFDNHYNYTFFEAVFRFPRFFKEEKLYKEKAMEILEFLNISLVDGLYSIS